MDAQARLRGLPSVDRVVGALETRGWLEGLPRRAATLCAREVLEETRRRLRDGAPDVTHDAIITQTATLLRRRFEGSLRRGGKAAGGGLPPTLGGGPRSAAARQ